MSPAEGTLLLSRRDVAELLDMDTCIAAVEQAFRLEGEGRLSPPAILGFPVEGGGFHVKAAALPGAPPLFAAKLNANFSGNPHRFGLPTIQGVVALFDAEKGRVLALLDSMEVTSLRTAAATAVAARYLARPDSEIAAICGCGVQGRAQLAALTRVMPIRTARVFDSDPTTAAVFARDLSKSLTIDIVAVATAREALAGCDVAVTCTPSRAAFLQPGELSDGAFLAAVGADAPEKQELDPALLASARVVVDSLAQCAAIGELHHAIETRAMALSDVHADLAAVVAGRRPGRTSREEIFVFDSTGTALEDVAAAAAIYRHAGSCGRGIRIDFSA
jgi:alanine dehydrogenase